METPQDPQVADAEDVARIWNFMEKQRTAFLVTISAAGPHARPMAAIVHKDEALIWFLTDVATTKDGEIAADNRVAVVFTDAGSSHVSVSGTAEIVDDRALVKSLWSTAAQAFWPDGPDSPRVVAIKVTPRSAELWDGPSKLVATVQMAAALATGNSVADMGNNVRAVLR